MALSIKTSEDNHMSTSPVAYYDALKDERRRMKDAGDERIVEVEAELKKAGPAALKDLHAMFTHFTATGDTRARGIKADIDRIEAELGRAPKVERAANTQGGDAGASRAAS